MGRTARKPPARKVPAAFDAKLPRLSQESDTREPMNDDINTLRRILKETRTIAVVGLSANWWRPSYFAAKYLQDHGYRVIPVNPQYQEVLGEKCYPSLRDVPLEVDVVDCFRKSEEIPDLADEAIAIGAKVLWMQLGGQRSRCAEGEPGRPRGSHGSLHEDRTRPALRRAQLVRREYQSDLREAPQLSCLLKRRVRH
jgi:predicted CoA-binding protein